MGRVKSIAVVIFLILFFTIISIYSCSDKGKLVTYRSQAGERLLNFLYRENLSRDILNVDNFRFWKLAYSVKDGLELGSTIYGGLGVLKGAKKN